jgi:outer membrane lipoprotein-sorting protein
VLRSIQAALPAQLHRTGFSLTSRLGRFSCALFLAFIAPASGAFAQAPQKWTLDSVLGMMDAAARDFHSLTANVEHIKYTDVVKDTSNETGQLWLRKKDDKMRIEFAKPDERTILRSGENLSIYNPKINRVEEYNLGKNRSLVDQYLELGFGTRSENLKKTYQVVFTGEQDFDGKKTILLELTPKSDEVRAQISKVQIWVEESSWLTVQQKFFEAGSADYLIFHYSDLKKNLKIDESRFKQDWPKNATKIKPRG